MASPQLSTHARDLLIEHIDGPVPLPRRSPAATFGAAREVGLRTRLIISCQERGWIAYNSKVSPTSTVMTDRGKEVLCAALAEWAEVLVRAAGWRDRLGFFPNKPGEVAKAKELDEPV